MSMTYTNYVIYGWDLTDYIDMDKFEEWKWEEGEKFLCNQQAGYVQMFDGGADSEKVHLGYVIWTSEEYNYDGDVTFAPEDLFILNNLGIPDVLYQEGILKTNFREDMPKAKIICFREYT